MKKKRAAGPPGLGHMRSKWHMVEKPKKGKGAYRRQGKHPQKGSEPHAGGLFFWGGLLGNRSADRSRFFWSALR